MNTVKYFTLGLIGALALASAGYAATATHHKKAGVTTSSSTVTSPTGMMDDSAGARHVENGPNGADMTSSHPVTGATGQAVDTETSRGAAGPRRE